MTGGECRMNNSFFKEFLLAYSTIKGLTTKSRFSLSAKRKPWNEERKRKEIPINWDKKAISDIGQKIWFQM